jgi:hypothetical protein
MTLEPHHFLHLKCDRLTSFPEGPSLDECAPRSQIRIKALRGTWSALP